MDQNQDNIKRYSKLAETHGLSYKALNWGSEKSQNLRFDVLGNVGDMSEKSVLDVGCGLGDFYDWLKKETSISHYHGIDITSKMVELASKRFPEASFEVCDFLVDPIEDADYIIASGIFTYQNIHFFEKFVEKLFEKARIAMAFNALSSWSDNQDPNEFYIDPTLAMEVCYKHTKQIVVRHDYHPGDFTIYMYKRTD